MKKFLITVSDDVTEDELRTLFFDWLLPDTFANNFQFKR